MIVVDVKRRVVVDLEEDITGVLVFAGFVVFVDFVLVDKDFLEQKVLDLEAGLFSFF